jgi:hypothetical protein
MGHLTYIAEEASKLLEKTGPEMDKILAAVNMNEWEDYVNGVLKETKERDSQPLGGVRPKPASPGLVPTLGGPPGTLADEIEFKAASSSQGPPSPTTPTRTSADTTEEDEESTASNELFFAGGTVGSDQVNGRHRDPDKEWHDLYQYVD